MTISFDRLLSNPVFNYFQTKIQRMDPLQKKIAIIGIACFSYLALVYLVRCSASYSLIENKRKGNIRENKRERQRPEPKIVNEEPILGREEIAEKNERKKE